jgi:hypothetical protein
VTSRFEIAGGSVIGRDHVRLGRNNQDAFCWSATPDAMVALVADGCGSGRYSEVGAQLGARLLVQAIRERSGAFDEEAPDAVLECARQDVLARLGELVRGMGGRPSQVVSDYWLFTSLGFVVTSRTFVVFGVGDGVVVVNGQTRVLTAANNEPAYLGYGLTGSSFAEEALRFTVFDRGAADDVTSLLVGTDGAGELGAAALAELWEGDRYFANPYNVGRRLTQWSRRAAHATDGAPTIALPDDTTVVVLRRGKDAP